MDRCQPNLSCLDTSYAFVLADSALMARRKGSQLDADAMDPKTIAIARKKYPPAIKPKAPVRSECIRGNRKHALMTAVPRRIVASGKEILVLYISTRSCILVVPKMMGASLSMGVTWFITMSVGRRFVDASQQRRSFFPVLITRV